MTSAVDGGPVRARAGWAWPAVAGLLLLATLAPEPAHAQTGICGRTEVVHDALVALIPGVSDCANVTAANLAAITGELDLSGVHGEDPRVTALAAGDFDGLTSLEELHLETNALTTLPDGVFDDLTALTQLTLEQNRLTGLPDGVFDNLTALTYLGLRNNEELTELPDGVFDNLTSLRTLLLRRNGMTELPDGMFDNLTALTWLHLAVNELTELPDGIFDNLTALRDLNLSNNELTELPDEVFDNLTALTRLNLARNPGTPFTSTADALPDDGTVPVAGGTVTLDGSGSGGAWGTNVTYSWALTNPPSGVTVTFDDAASAMPMVTIPALTTGTELTFTLTVTGRGTTNPLSEGSGAPGTDTATVTVSPAGTLLLTLDAIAGDNTVNIAEKAAGFSIGGATGTESGVSVTVTVGSTTLAAATSATGGAWSVAVPANAAYLTGTSVTVTVSASKTGYTAPSDVTRALAVDLTAPSATYTAPSSLQVGVAVGAMTPSTTDTDIASYGATGLPPGLGIDTGTGVIDGTPDTADANTADATVTVTDTAGNTDTVDITFPAVAKGDQTLTGFAYSPASVTFGGAAPAVTAPGGVQTTLSYSATPATVCTVDASTGALTLVGVGDCVITATAAPSDDYNQGTAIYTVTVAAAGTLDLTLDAIAGDDTVNIAEKAAGFAISGAAGSQGGVSVTVTVGGTELTATSATGGAWSVDVPAGASYLTGTSVAVTVSASKTGYTPPGDVTRALAVDLTAPSATYTAPSSLQVGMAIGALTPSTTDTDIASYGATGLPPGLGIDSTTGAISGTPDTADANIARATVTVTDAAGNTATVSIAFPAVAKGDQTLTGFAYSPAAVTYGDTAPTVTAPGGVQTALSYSATPATVCTVDASTGALMLVGLGECAVTATAAPSDDYNQGTAIYTVTVAAAGALALTLDTIAGDDTVNIAEKAAGFAIGGATGSEGGVTVTVTVGGMELTATSAAGGAWSVDVPPGASYLTGTSVAVTVSASKTGYTPPGDVTRALAVDLTAPSATYTAPSSLQVGMAVGAMTPSTTDTDIASYGATGLPPGLGIDSTTGAISGTPDTADANTAHATVTVTDTAGNTATVSIAFPAVAKGDQTLTGFAYSPASVTYGDTAPAVTAPSGVQTTLSYSATPATVCTVDASTGALMLVGLGECAVTATAAPSDDYNQGTAIYTVTVAAAGALALNLDTIAGDDTVNSAEKTAGFAIGGATGSQGGVTVTVTVGGMELTATSAAGGAWSVDVPAGASYLTGTSVAVTVSASKTGYTPPSDVTRALAVDLTAPSATYTAPGTLKVGVAASALTPSTTDTDIASYGATGLPPGLGIDTSTGVISGTPGTADANTARATVTVTDTAGNTATVSITFPAVAKGDQTLTGFAYRPATVTYGDTAPAVTAPSGVQTTLSYSATPATVCTVDASTGALMLVGLGECAVTATAAPSDDYNQGTAIYTVTVAAAGTLDLTLDAIAGDDTVNIAEKAAGFAISGATGSEGGVSVTVTVGGTELTATSAAAGAWSVDVPAGASYLTGTSVAVTVSASKTGYTPPSDLTRALAVDLTAPSATYTAPSSLKVGMAIGALTPSTTDTDIASYGATGLPPGLGIDTGTGVISGTPDTADANTASAAVTVTDTAGNTVDIPITFPAVAKGDQTLTGFAYSPASVTYGDTAPAVTAPSGVQTTLSYSATPATVCTVDASTGALMLVGLGECAVTATAAPSDDYNQGTAIYTVTVAAAGALALNLDTIAGDDTVNSAEKTAGFAIGGATGSEGGVTVTVTVGGMELTATSAAGGAWSVAVPAGASYLTGTSVAVTVSASKTGYTPPSDLTRALAVDLTAPSATYTAPSSLQVGVAVGALTPSTTDTDIASYGATGLPPGLGIDSATGAISGTPDTADANTARATVTVTDTAGNTATVSIAFPAVAKGDQTLTGFAYSPATVTYGDTAPAVTAPGGVQTTLSYSATPATVCTVDASTGALTLVGAGDCNITATAAGAANYNEATAAFTVTVQAAGALALNLDTIAGDDTVNITEKAAGFAIGGATGSQGGVTVTVTVGGTELTATSAAGGAWSVDVPANAAYLTDTSVAVTVSASKTGYTPPSDLTRALAVDLTAPSATYTAPSSLQVGMAVGAMTPSTTDTDIASYGATGLPPGLGIDTGTGVISGTPDTADASTARATVTVTDTAGNTATVSIAFPAVAKGDQTLTGFAYSPATVTYGDTAPAVTAPGGVQTALSYSATPATVCTVDASTGALTLVGLGECAVTATAAPSDDYNQGTAIYTVTVAAAGALALNLDTIAGDDTVNSAEKAAGFAISGATGSEGGVTVTVTVGGTELTATSATGGAWSVDVPANAAYLTGTSVAVTVSASKTGYTPPSDLTRALAVDLTAPSATYTAPSSLQVGMAVGAMTPSTTDTDIASYGATGLPPGLGIDTGTGVISGTPDTADASTARATVTVTDTAGNTATVSIAFPAVAKGDQTLTGFAYSPATVTYGDTAPAVTAPGGVQTTLSYSATPATVCTVDASTGALTLVGVGECAVTATAAGATNYNEATAAFTVTVQAAGALALNLDTIAGDDTVNIAEKAAGFAISGATGSQGGVSVTVTVGGTELTATSAAGGAWSVAVPAGASYLTGTSVAVTVSASKTGYTPPSDLTRALAVDLTAPSATYTAPSSLKVGVAVSAMTPSTTDTDIASYGATGLPPGLGIDSTTGAISGTPDTADANTARATVTVTDTAGNTATVSIAFPAVAKGDQTLTGFAYSPATVTYGDTAPAVTAPGGVQTTLSYSATPATVCTVDASTGALTLVGVGECAVTATAAGATNYNEATAAFTVTLQAAGALALNLDTIAGDDTVNIAEKAAGFAISGATGSQGGVSVTVTVGGTELTATSAAGGAWSVDVPAGASYLTGTSVAVTVSASKTGYTPPSDLTRALAVDLTAPSATYTAPSSLKVGVAIGALTPTTTDTDIASYGATGLPPGLGIDTGTGVISGTPDTADANTASAAVTVTDTAGNTATVSIAFPAVAKGDQTLTGFAYSPATVTYGDTAPAVTAPSGVQTTLSYSATPATVCTVDASTGALTLVGVGDCNITATAAGAANYNEATAAFTVTVQAAGALALNLDTIAGDDTVNITEKAAGFAISGATGSQGGVSVTVTVGGTELTATSTAGGAWSVDVPAGASYLTGTSVAVTVSASKTGFSSPSDLTRALAVDLTAPAASYTAPGTLKVGVAIGALTPTTTDTDIASYGATGLPPGLGIDTGTGVISGTPDTADANTASAAVTVTDTAGNTATVSIAFPAVAKGDQTLTGFAYSPATVTYGDTAPAVTAPSGVQTTLSYSATPATVCTVDASTGALTLVGVGDCNITATAAGAANYNEATAAFTVTVQAAGALALNLDTIAGDDTVNIAEKAAGFAISGAAGSQGGVSVTVTVGGTELTATSTAGGAWSVDVPAGASYLTGTSVAVTVSASKTGYTPPSDLTRALAVDLTAPSATYTAPSSLKVGVAVGALTPTTTDTDIASYGAMGLPPGLGIDTGTGVISGTPDTADANTASAAVTVTDPAGNTVDVPIAFPAVAKGDQTLTGFAYSPATVTYGDTAPTVTAPSGVQTTLSYSAAPATVCTVDASTGALTLVGAGDCNITATAAGAANYNEATAAFTVTVQAAGVLALNLDTIAGDDTVNIAEKAAGFAISGAAGSQGGVSVTVTVGGTELTATSTAGGAWSVDVPAGASYLTGTSVAVTVSASKTGYTPPSDLTRALAVDLTAPSATYTAPSSLKVGVAVGALTPTTTDTDIASYGAMGLPPGLGIDTGTGVISGTPDTADANTASAAVTVTDTAGNTVDVPIAFPAVAKGDQTLTGFAYSPATVTYGDTAPTVTAPGGVQTTLSYSATPATVCTVDASTGALTLVGVGDCNITATAAGAANYNEATAAFTVMVADDPEGFDIAIDAPAAVDEDAGTATVTYTLTTRQNSAPVADTDMYYVPDPSGTATRGDDYTPPPGRVGSAQSVIFATVPPSAFSPNAAGTAWVAQRSFTIGIVDDEEAEARETIVFEVRTEGDHRSPEHTVTIRDDDTTVIRNASVVNGPGADGVWSAGEPVELEVRYNYPVEVEQPSDCWAYNDDGTCRESGPFLVVSFRSDARPGYGRVLSTPLAPYEGGSGTNRLRFAYTVGAAEDGAKGVWAADNGILLRGATIRPLGDGEVGSESTNTRVRQVDVVKPGERAWTAGEEVRVKVRFAGPEQYTPPDQPQNRDTVEVNESGGTPTIRLLLGDRERRGLSRTARYKRGSGTDTLVFEYEVTARDGRVGAVEVEADSLALNGATIRNEDGYDAELDHLSAVQYAQRPALSVADAEATEGEDATLDFVVKLDGNSGSEVKVDFRTRDGTAEAGSDYTETRGSLTFAPGEYEKTVSVPILDDDVEDEGETFKLLLSNVSGAEVANDDYEAVGTIRNSEGTARPELTAKFRDMPSSHDGETAFTFRVAFSEDIGISFKALREDAFTVTGGRVTGGRRVGGRRDLFEMTVEPDSDADVTITLQAGRDCATSGAICTKGKNRRQLTNSPSATVAGPSDERTTNTAATGAPAIRGTAQVGEELTASTSGISDADGLENVRFAYQWIRGSDDIRGATRSRYTAVDADEGERLQVRVRFTDDAGNRESLTSAATEAVAARPVPLTAEFVDMPAEHRGEGGFHFRVAFSEDIGISFAALREDAFRVTGGRVTGGKRVDGRRDLFRMTVRPDSDGDVTITLPAGRACGVSGAICTKSEPRRQLTNSPSATVRGPVGISVADARVEEGAEAVLAFVVTLSRAASGTLRVDYATSDGSAHAGDDYRAANGSLKFRSGETSQRIEVAVLDDDHDEGEETLTLRLSNPSSGRLRDGEATGTIENGDPLPRALLARFGRAAAVHVVEQVEERLEARREPGFEGRFAGRAVRPGMERELAEGFLRRLGMAAGVDPAAGAGAAEPLDGARRRRLEGLLSGSGFALNRATRHGGTVSLWSRGAQSRFAGREGALSLGGAVRTTMFGADYVQGPLTAGVSLSHSGGVGEYAGHGLGEVVSSVTGLYPWLGYRATERISVWGVAGYGSGSLALTPEGGAALKSGLGMAMGALGARGELFGGRGAAGYGLAFRTDALWVRTAIEGVDGPSGRLKATAAAVTRLRTALEGSRDFRFGSGLSLKPSVELGVRRDGGDAETGAGLDMGGGLVVSAPSVGLSADVRVRVLLAHEAEAFRDRGVSVALSYDPTPATPFGLRARLAPSWGGQATSGAEALWGRETLSGMASGGFGAAGSRLDADLGYGLPVGSRLVGTPRLGVMTSGMGRDYRVGYGLGVLAGGPLSFELGIDAQRRESPLAGGVNHGVAARATLSW